MVAVAPFIGSFLGVLALRLPERRPIGWSRSACDRCGHVLSARDLVPIVSYALLRGRCRYCRGLIGRFALAMELGAMAVPVWAGLQTAEWVFVGSCVLGWILLLLAVIDWRTQLLPDLVTLPLLALGLIWAVVMAPETIVGRLIGVASGFGGLALLAFAYTCLRGREGLGLGDAKLLGAIGAWVSWQGLPTVVLWGSMLGLLFALARSVAGHRVQLSDRLPFGVFLAAGGWLVWLYGPLMFAFV